MANRRSSSGMPPRHRAWLYKCTLNPAPGGGEYSWIDPRVGFFAGRGHIAEDFGGEDWVRSSHSWSRLAQVRRGDLVFCHQSDLHGLVGMTVAASDGYADPEGDHPERCTTLDLGPARVRFDNIVSVAQVRQHVGNVGAYAPGKQQSTFHEVESARLKRLIALCARLNPRQRAQITRLVGESASVSQGEHAAALAVLSPGDMLHDPIRREMTVEAFERKAAWAKLARRVYGFACMVPGCKFKLVKSDRELFIEVHHLRPMFDGGSPNDIRNMSVLCPNHHRAVHYGSDEARYELERVIRREQATRLKRAGVF